MAESSLYAGQKPVLPEALHYDFMSNGSTINAVGDYSGEGNTESFRITCEPGSRRLEIHRMIIYIEDVGAFKSARYGVDLQLVEGIHVQVKDGNDAVISDHTANDPILTNAQWGALCYDVTMDTFGTGNNGSLIVRWTFANAGHPLSLSQGDYLSVDLNDDFTGLVEHRFMVQGYYRL